MYMLHTLFNVLLITIRGKNYEENCKKSGVVMDDLLTGVIIDGVLGIDLNVTDEFRSQFDDMFSGNSEEVRKHAQVGYSGD